MSLRNAAIPFVLLLAATGCSMKATVYGLKPEYPVCSSSKTEIVFVNVDSLQPTFRWESFPRPHDMEEDKGREGMLSRIREVTYDLRIWDSENDYPAAIIYSRQGIKEPIHMIENPLKPCANYFWTVRARFVIDDQTRVTEWGILKFPQMKRGHPSPRRSTIIPNPNLYRFKTPCQRHFILF